MKTLVVSDLHLGSRTDADVLRRAEAREALAAAVAGVDRLVLLGDILELRHGPVAEALEAAAPTFAALAAALGRDTEVVLLAGNHDHAVVAPWLERRAMERRPLGLEERTRPDATPIGAAIAEALAPARVSVAYPGVWLRDDVYATHGHYLDVHVTIPTFERLGSGAMRRLVGGGAPLATPDDYEAILAPLYAWMHVVARHTKTGFGAERQRGTQNAWTALTGRSGRRPLKTRAMVAGFPVAVAGINRLGLGPVGRDLSPTALRQSGLRAMHEVARGLAIDAGWVLFGHTHRTGPRDRDRHAEWEGSPRLMNTGSWVHERVFLGDAGRDSPYWPGGAVLLDGDAPPALLNLLPAFVP